MLNIVGKCKVTNLKEVGKMIVGTLVSFQKDGEEFVPTFISAKFVGEAKDIIMSEGIMDKDNIDVISGILGTRVWKNKEGMTVRDIQATVFKLQRNVDVIEVKEDKPKSKFKK